MQYPFPIAIPCHLAIRSDGALGGYQGSLKMKRTLLAMEGVAFRDAGHVATRRFFYEDITPLSKPGVRQYAAMCNRRR
ncbi:MAG: MGMT family protein [Syntrophales bacterium]|jgi:methylated-DNA-[protein]-cysteine S-methyltransferase